jgi:hypothetical protein
MYLQRRRFYRTRIERPPASVTKITDFFARRNEGVGGSSSPPESRLKTVGRVTLRAPAPAGDHKNIVDGKQVLIAQFPWEARRFTPVAQNMQQVVRQQMN